MFVDLLRAKLSGICEISDQQAATMQAHYELLLRWNRVLSLTTVTDVESAVERHYCESVFAAIHLPVGAWSVADLGSGAGFPGLPIAIIRPECTVTLIESHQRKAAFLKEAARAMRSVRVIARRAEDVRERFDWLVSRAVRVDQVAGPIKSLAGSVELLTGEVDVAGLSGIEWDPPIPIPWGNRGYLRIGRFDTK